MHITGSFRIATVEANLRGHKTAVCAVPNVALPIGAYG